MRVAPKCLKCFSQKHDPDVTSDDEEYDEEEENMDSWFRFELLNYLIALLTKIVFIVTWVLSY